MSNSYFQFKQFTVRQDKCAMKVGTDGVLLGAWVDVDRCNRILDVGTGTGLIALMLAQRSEATVDAIDIDAAACEQAQENAAASPFAGRVQVAHAAFANFDNTHPYDLIVSNPPYFARSLKCPDQQRSTARHNDTLPLDELLQDCRKRLTPTGRVALILPYDRKEELESVCEQFRFYFVRKTAVVSVAGLPPKRLLAELQTAPCLPPDENQLVIEQADHSFTADYIRLTKAFYLKM